MEERSSWRMRNWSRTVRKKRSTLPLAAPSRTGGVAEAHAEAGADGGEFGGGVDGAVVDVEHLWQAARCRRLSLRALLKAGEFSSAKNWPWQQRRDGHRR